MSLIKKRALSLFMLMLCAMLVIACLPSYAFAWTKTYTSGTRTYSVSPTYQSFNKGMVNSYGNYLANCRSEMTAYCSSGVASAGSMKVQGVMTYGTMDGDEYSELGLLVTNANSMAQYAQLTGIKELEISNLKGQIGALAWGMGSVRSSSGTWTNLGTDYLLIATLDAYGNIVPASVGGDEVAFSDWQLGHDNFIGIDGKVYGVPAISPSGEVIQPDMLRVLLDDGTKAYISRFEMDEITSQAVAQLDYDREAELFVEELQTNNININQAKEIINEYKVEGSLEDNAIIGSILRDTNDGEEIECFSDYIGDALTHVAGYQRVAVPAYSDSGIILGYYYIDIL